MLDFAPRRPQLALVLASALGSALVACLATSQYEAPLVTDEQCSAAVRKSLPLLQDSASKWFEERSCVSCHHHGLGVMSATLAAERGFVIDTQLLEEQIEHGVPWDPGTIEEVLQGDAGINGQLGQGYKLIALATGKLAADAHTDARARFLLDKQGPDGRWLSNSHRPPLEDCDTTATALASRAIQLYPPPGNGPRVARAVELARDWLDRSKPGSNEERTMQLFGLAWTHADARRIRKSAAELMEKQRSDGGWAQIDTRSSDAYATGQALVALHQVGGLSVKDACYQRGLAYLIRWQESDGSWYLETRRRTDGLPHFETGFPHAEHQFIAYAASAWATMALTCGAHPGPSTIFESTAALARAAPAPADKNPLPPLVESALYGEFTEMRALLDAGADVNRTGARGLTSLMGAVHDREKAQLLLGRKAQLEARSELGFSALILAAGTQGSQDVVKMLLARGADVHARAKDGTTVLSRAVESGNRDLVEFLVRAGAEVDAPSTEDKTALNLAVWQGDAPMVATLLTLGADPDGKLSAGEGTPLISATIDGFPFVVAALIDAGARVEATDDLGRTALSWAAIVDFGDDRTLQLLLNRGASVQARDLDGTCVLDHARTTGRLSAMALIEQRLAASR